MPCWPGGPYRPKSRPSNRRGAMMRNYINAISSGLIILLSMQLQSTAQAAENYSCWITRVVARDGKLYISFRPGYRQRAFVTNKLQEPESVTPSKAPSDDLVMSENEKATNSNGLHSGCTITAERHEGRLGIQVRAYDSLPGIMASERTEFIPAATPE